MTIELALYGLSMLLLLGASSMKMQRVTRGLGRYIAKGNPFGGAGSLQSAVTPRAQVVANTLAIVAFPLAILGFFIFPWYIPLLSFAGGLIVSGVVDAFRSSRLAPYIGKIVADLARRSANYAKKGDRERSDAAKEMSETVTRAFTRLSIIYGEDVTIAELERKTPR